jgi:hypothetical protein
MWTSCIFRTGRPAVGCVHDCPLLDMGRFFIGNPTRRGVTMTDRFDGSAEAAAQLFRQDAHMGFFEEGGMIAGDSVDFHPTGREPPWTATIAVQIFIALLHKEYGKGPRVRARDILSPRR